MGGDGDYYELLDVDPDASIEAIERGYRERVKEVHPDRNDAADAAAQFTRVRRARDVLTDPEERARYDRIGHDRYAGTSETVVHEPGRSWSAPEPDTSEGTAPGPGAAETESNTAATGAADGTTGTASRRQDRPGATGADTEGGTTRYAVRTEYAVSNELSWAGLSAPQAAIGLAMFMIYPGLLVGAATPRFTPMVNLVVALCLLAVVSVLLTMPRVGIVVFGAWIVVGPPLLLLTGVGVLSLVGVLFMLGNLLPFGLALANFLATGGGS